MLSLALSLLALSTGCDRDPNVGVPEPYRTMDVPRDLLDSHEARRDGRELYLAMCSLCHGQEADGRGPRSNLGTDPRDFTSQRWRRAMTPRRVHWIIQEGRRGTPMPSFSMLSESQTWDLVAYVLSVAEEGPLVEGVDVPKSGDATSGDEAPDGASAS